MFDIQQFKTRIKQARENKGLKQEEFAKIIGIARANVSYYENPKNTVTPNAEVLCSMANELGVSLDYLMGNTESKIRENIDIEQKLGLYDSVIKEIEDRKAVAEETRIWDLDISSALNIMLTDTEFCDEFFPNFHGFVDENACNAVFQTIVKRGIVTKHTDGSSIFLLGMEHALRSLRDRTLSKCKKSLGEEN